MLSATALCASDQQAELRPACKACRPSRQVSRFEKARLEANPGTASRRARNNVASMHRFEATLRYLLQTACLLASRRTCCSRLCSKLYIAYTVATQFVHRFAAILSNRAVPHYLQCRDEAKQEVQQDTRILAKRYIAWSLALWLALTACIYYLRQEHSYNNLAQRCVHGCAYRRFYSSQGALASQLKCENWSNFIKGNKRDDLLQMSQWSSRTAASADP